MRQTLCGLRGYREMPSNYANGQDLAYVVPSSETDATPPKKVAPALLIGHNGGGLEKVSIILICALFCQTRPSKFLHLRRFRGRRLSIKSIYFEKDSDGSPKYFIAPARLVGYNSICNESLYKSVRQLGLPAI